MFVLKTKASSLQQFAYHVAFLKPKQYLTYNTPQVVINLLAMNLFCLLVIGWELLSVGNLFCWFQLVASKCWQELQVLF